MTRKPRFCSEAQSAEASVQGPAIRAGRELWLCVTHKPHSLVAPGGVTRKRVKSFPTCRRLVVSHCLPNSSGCSSCRQFSSCLAAVCSALGYTCGQSPVGSKSTVPWHARCLVRVPWFSSYSQRRPRGGLIRRSQTSFNSISVVSIRHRRPFHSSTPRSLAQRHAISE